ncbi:AMP-binding protein [Streptomyces anthocyanicus]|uniref:AMP-binding protein n=1 Tax=Streptomyces anthocyanicus TaxID=68174 RepID=UPI003656E07E
MVCDQPVSWRSATTEQFPGAVLDLLHAAGGRAVFEHDGRELSGRHLLGMTRRVAAAPRQHGVGPGRGPALLLGVGPEAFAAVIAAYTVGARVVGVRPGMTDHQRAALPRDAEVTVTVTDGPAHRTERTSGRRAPNGMWAGSVMRSISGTGNRRRWC